MGATIKSIKDVSVDIVKGFYTKWYVPSNMAVIVVGDITETQVCHNRSLNFDQIYVLIQ